MPHRNIIAEESEEAIWKVITDQLNSRKDEQDYSVQFSFGNYRVTLDIDILPDHGEDGEKPYTSFTTPVSNDNNFRFKIEQQGLKHQIGKLFGTQDIVVGQPDVDKKYLIQSNNEEKVKEMLKQSELSTALLRHPVANFEIKENKIGVTRETVLRLDVEGAITEPSILQSLFQTFKTALSKLG
jgi:hypothetical protein